MRMQDALTHAIAIAVAQPLIDTTYLAALRAARDRLVEQEAAQLLTDDDIRAWWRAAGGFTFPAHGENIVTMPNTYLFALVRGQWRPKGV